MLLSRSLEQWRAKSQITQRRAVMKCRLAMREVMLSMVEDSCDMWNPLRDTSKRQTVRDSFSTTKPMWLDSQESLFLHRIQSLGSKMDDSLSSARWTTTTPAKQWGKHVTWSFNWKENFGQTWSKLQKLDKPPSTSDWVMDVRCCRPEKEKKERSVT